MNALTPTSYVYASGAQLRTLGADEGVRFVLTDVCEALGITNSRDATRRLDPDQKGVADVDTPGGVQRMTTVTESGLYALIMTSGRPRARRFTRWVTDEVIPSIRSTGHYETRDALARLTDEHERGMRLVQCLLTGVEAAEQQCSSIDEVAERMLAMGGRMGDLLHVLNRREARLHHDKGLLGAAFDAALDRLKSMEDDARSAREAEAACRRRARRAAGVARARPGGGLGGDRGAAPG